MSRQESTRQPLDTVPPMPDENFSFLSVVEILIHKQALIS
jgi:hypothetical protein